MTREPARGVTLTLLVVVVALIAYGSLYPFKFQPDVQDGGLLRALSQLSWQRAGRGDRISNVLLYLPLGFCLFLWFASRYRRRVSLGLATAVGAALSLTIEVLQFYISVRVSSLTDIALNAAGSLLGATGGLAWRALNALVHQPSRSEVSARDPGAAVLLALWLAWSFAPFAPQFDLAKLKSALRPLFHPQFEPAAVFIFLTCWLVVNQALAALFRRPRRLEALLIMIAVVLIARLVIAGRSFVPAELLALLLLLPLIVLMHRLKPRPRRAALVLAVVAVVIIENLAPFDFSAKAVQFDFWPFMPAPEAGWSGAVHAIDWIELCAGLFLTAALVWVLKEWGAPINLAVAVAVALSLAMEALQIWLPQHRASITDPLLAVAVASTMRTMYVRRKGMMIRG